MGTRFRALRESHREAIRGVPEDAHCVVCDKLRSAHGDDCPTMEAAFQKLNREWRALCVAIIEALPVRRR